MNRFAILLSVLCLFGLNSLAQAGFHMEPHVGFGISNEWEQGSFSEDVSRTYSGIKLGYQADMGLQVGGEIQIGSGTYKAGGSFGTDIDYLDVSIGPYLGYQTAMGFRGYVGVFRSAQAFDDTNNSTVTGVGFKLGAGYRIIDWLAVNLEYHMTSYDELDDDSSFTSSDLNPSLDVNAIMLVASFPFNFGGGN